VWEVIWGGDGDVLYVLMDDVTSFEEGLEDSTARGIRKTREEDMLDYSKMLVAIFFWRLEWEVLVEELKVRFGP